MWQQLTIVIVSTKQSPGKALTHLSTYPSLTCLLKNVFNSYQSTFHATSSSRRVVFLPLSARNAVFLALLRPELPTCNRVSPSPLPQNSLFTVLVGSAPHFSSSSSRTEASYHKSTRRLQLHLHPHALYTPLFQLCYISAFILLLFLLCYPYIQFANTLFILPVTSKSVLRQVKFSPN